ncbi:MAG: DUF1080 domain-containing protein [Planctomycetaceae bacterium]|jgi:hypothetical protein|nr:DUF1080 domain-containing protein [Planctomycetaceae bacterium]
MRRWFFACFLLGSICYSASVSAQDWRSGIPWEKPVVVTPGAAVSDAPSDAIILFDGKNMDAWSHQKWKVEDGAVTITGGGSVNTKQKFGSVQLHIEFMTPTPAKGKGQGRGNSGILFFGGKYEVQVLDSYEDETYFDGQCAAIYKQRPPLVNACKKPGEWQTYDIFFNKPKLKVEDGKVVEVERPARLTVVQNGVLVVNAFDLEGETAWHIPPTYTPIPDKGPIMLQDHGNPVKYRNIWVREIPDTNFKPERTREPYYEGAK